MSREWSLESIEIESTLDLPFAFLEEVPSWWTPEASNAEAYYSASEEYSTGGVRQMFLVFDSDSAVVYVVEHFEGVDGG